jgi:tetratricopeptide (TPR) repeat protein
VQVSDQLKNKNMKRIFLASSILLLACSKQEEWLEIKTNKTDVILSTVSDYQALLDADQFMNGLYPYMGQLACDDYYITYAQWQSAAVTARNSYVWALDIFEGAGSNDWTGGYITVEYANICLDGLKKIERDAPIAAAWDNVQGAALFFRSQAFYNLLTIFAPVYNPASSNTDMGIPLRTSCDVNIPSKRATVEESYKQVIADLEAAEKLLPASSAYQTRPTKTAVYGLLARIYLSMRDYQKAYQYADKALQQNSYVLDFNTLNTTLTNPMPTYQTGNKEVIFYATTTNGVITTPNGLVDTILYNSYANNDLRKTVYFKSTTGGYNFRGQYTGVQNPFGGLATNEQYLIRAECAARNGDIAKALSDLNTLLVKRWKTGTFTPVTAATASDALSKILIERRKELIFYGSTRWADLRRFNLDPSMAITLKRNLNGTIYTLPPNDPRYVYPIPDAEILLSGIQQNKR